MLSIFQDETHRALAESARGWVNREIAPFARQWEEENLFPRALYKKAGDAGLLGVTYPESYGGGGGDVFHGLVVLEALVRGGSVGTAAGLGSHMIALPPILKMGSEAQRQRWAPGIISGALIAALAITEPGVGSDVAGLQCSAVREGDRYRVNGSKMFITSGARADLVVAAVRTGGPGHDGISLLVIEKDTPGFTVGRALKKMGWWASDTAELNFQDCMVPAENLLGPENSGFLAIVMNFVPERLMLAATGVAQARLALDLALEYTQQREAFGRPIGKFQVVRHTLAEMATREAAARSMVATVAERWRRGEDCVAAVAMAKNHAAEMAVWVCDKAVQLHGGYGYMREYTVETLFRDARLLPIGGGTTEIMRELISRRLAHGG